YLFAEALQPTSPEPVSLAAVAVLESAQRVRSGPHGARILVTPIEDVLPEVAQVVDVVFLCGTRHEELERDREEGITQVLGERLPLVDSPLRTQHLEGTFALVVIDGRDGFAQEPEALGELVGVVLTR